MPLKEKPKDSELDWKDLTAKYRNEILNKAEEIERLKTKIEQWQAETIIWPELVKLDNEYFIRLYKLNEKTMIKSIIQEISVEVEEIMIIEKALDGIVVEAFSRLRHPLRRRRSTASALRSSSKFVGV